MEPANNEQSAQPATRFLITLSETNTRDIVVQIYNNVYCSREKERRVEFKAPIFANQTRKYN
jgi:hypothetical protein